MDKSPNQRVRKASLYGNWSDTWGFPLAEKLLPVALLLKLTPNIITIIGFVSFTLGSFFLFSSLQYHLILSAFLLPFGFLMDDLDGQLARARKMSSELGNYLDKVLDVLKIFILMASLSYAVYLQTGNVLYIFLGFTAASFFYMRYYIKLESVMRQAELDKNYLEKSSHKMREVEHETLNKLSKSNFIKRIWIRNRIIFFVDEAEFAVLTAACALINRLEIALWVLAVSQVLIFFWRFWERAYQTVKKSPRLYYFMRK